MFGITVWVLTVQRGLRGSHVMLCTAFLLWALPTAVCPPLAIEVIDIVSDMVHCSGYVLTSTLPSLRSWITLTKGSSGHRNTYQPSLPLYHLPTTQSTDYRLSLAMPSLCVSEPLVEVLMLMPWLFIDLSLLYRMANILGHCPAMHHLARWPRYVTRHYPRMRCIKRH